MDMKMIVNKSGRMEKIMMMTMTDLLLCKAKKVIKKIIGYIPLAVFTHKIR